MLTNDFMILQTLTLGTNFIHLCKHFGCLGSESVLVCVHFSIEFFFTYSQNVDDPSSDTYTLTVTSKSALYKTN